MYDKVKFWIDRTIVGEQFPTIVNYLDSAKQETDLDTGEVRTFGYLDGMRVIVYVGGLSVVGSLPKFLYGSNVYPLDRHTTSEAIEKMAEALHIPMEKALVTGMEFGTNFLMKHPVPDYLAKLGDMPRLQRYNFNASTLYYKGMGKAQPKVFAFYDKIADAKAKGMAYPEDMNGENLLKYELRLNGRLPHQLGVPEVKASTLYQTPFYRMMVKRYQDSYFSISKMNMIKTNVMSEIKTVTDAFKVFVARLVSQTGQSQIGGFLDELKDAGVFKDKKNYSRLKKKILEVATEANFTVSDELMKELDDEIRNCGAYV